MKNEDSSGLIIKHMVHESEQLKRLAHACRRKAHESLRHKRQAHNPGLF